MKYPTHEWNVKLNGLNNALIGNHSLLISNLLQNRGVKGEQDAKWFMSPTMDGLHSPFLLNDMHKARERIMRAVNDKELIYIFGDYDADGTTATALLIDVFRKLEAEYEYHIPNRFTDGYGISTQALVEAYQEGCSLIVSVDCGITAVEEVQYAKDELGIDFIITDHHEPQAELPNAYAIISPKVEGSTYPYTELAGVGLAFKLAQALVPDIEFQESLLDLVALGTVVDIAPLTGENRTLTRLGLNRINRQNFHNIDALCRASKINHNEYIGGYALGFKLGPRINSAGRMDDARKVVEMLTSFSPAKASRIAMELDAHNKERKWLEKSIEKEATDIIETFDLHYYNGIVVSSRNWEKRALGVVGIVAARLSQTYNKPVIVLASDGETASGSGRSVGDIDLADTLTKCSEWLTKFGGHKAAAGLTIPEKNISQFQEALHIHISEQYEPQSTRPVLDIDTSVKLSEITVDSLKEVLRLEPFGNMNPSPVYIAKGCRIESCETIGKDGKHVKMRINDYTAQRDLLVWNAPKEILQIDMRAKRYDFTFTAELNLWNARLNTQLVFKDMREYKIEQ